MVLDKYISDLLYRYDCVIVPEFGGFISNTISAKNISSQNKFLPPTKEIGFNKFLNKNDGLLSYYISQSKGISYNKALEYIKDNVSKWNSKLETNKYININDIGSFRLTEERVLEFYATDSINYLTDSYGLSTFTAISVNGNNTNKQKNTRVYNSNSTPKIMRYVALAISFVAVGSMSYYQLKTIPQSTNRAEFDFSAISNIDEDIIKATASNKDYVISKKPKVQYHIISGAFGVKDNAKKELSRLQNKGITGVLLNKNKSGLYLVAYRSFDDINNAQDYLKKIRDNDKKAWILKK